MSDIAEEATPAQSRTSWSGWFRGLCCRVLRAGDIPRHVAIIMDGNRRFARKMRYDHSMRGHALGFEKFRETLEWCFDLGIAELTVYAFSIENFKRSKEEVDGLMELAKLKIDKLLEERAVIMRHGVCIRVLGDLELLPSDVQQSVAKAVLMTQGNNKAYLNVCFAYTSRHEMAAGMKLLAEGVEEGLLKPSDVSEELMERCLYTGDSPPPDLVIRTSGEIRLSDFLLWQSSYSCLCFQSVLWPEFSIRDFFSAILHYQSHYTALQEARRERESERERRQWETDTLCVEELGFSLLSPEQLEQKTRQYAAERRRRIDSFLEHVRTKRRLFLEQACPNS